MPAMNQTTFRGRVAVVTGGNRGIGLATARQLARGGARLSLWARDTARLEAAAAELSALTEVHLAEADVADEQAVRAAAASAMERFGRVDILVNNAGTLGPRAPVGSYPAEDFMAVLRTNLMGTFHCCSALVPHMTAAGYGRIVNIASVAGKDGNPFVSGYVASKAAQIAFTKSLGKELATSGVLVNAVTPSASPTEIFGELDDKRKRALLANVPMARFVEPEEVARMIAWLCSEACSFSTAATFDISGGRATF